MVLNLGRRRQRHLSRPSGRNRRLRHRPGQRADRRLRRCGDSAASRDEDGRLAAAGLADARVVAALMRDPYFDRRAAEIARPQSFPRRRGARRRELEPTPTARRRCSPSPSRRRRRRRDQFAMPPTRWLVCGGGRLQFGADERGSRRGWRRRSNRSRRSASTATSSRRNASPIWRFARAPACRFRCRPRRAAPLTGGDSAG